MENIQTKRKELEKAFQGIENQVNEYLESLKKRSSDEIFKGSIQNAQKLLAQILPIENGYKKYQKCQNQFLDVLTGHDDENYSEADNSNDVINSEQNGENDIEQEENKKVGTNGAFTHPEEFRIPILKALIYLGGSAKSKDAFNFIERDMKKKFKDKDLELADNSDSKLWVENLTQEKNNMTEAGLLSTESSNGSWEIVQKGIDYLAKHGK